MFRKLISIALSVISLLAIFVLCFTGCQKSGGNDDSYFVLEKNETCSIIRVNSKGKKKSIYTTGDIITFAVNDDEICFADGDFNICHIDKNGKNYSVIFNCRDKLGEVESVTYLHSTDKYIFFRVNGFEFYLFDRENGTIKEIYYDAGYIGFTEEYLLFSGKEKTVYKFDLQSTEIVPLFSARSFIIIDNLIFYTGVSGGIFEFNSGTEIDDSKNIRIDSLGKYKGNLFYVKKEEEQYCLFTYSGDGLKKVAVLEDYSHGGNVDDGHFMYFVNRDDRAAVDISKI